eukprot:COSAG05_NODE_1441_length_4880_cov_3.567245_6_plen_82_part_00
MLSAHVGDCGMRQDAVFAAVNLASRWLWTRDRRFLTNSFGTQSNSYSLFTHASESMPLQLACFFCALAFDPISIVPDGMIL